MSKPKTEDQPPATEPTATVVAAKPPEPLDVPSLAKALDEYRASLPKSEMVEFVVHTTGTVNANHPVRSAIATRDGQALKIKARGFTRQEVRGRRVLAFETEGDPSFVDESIVSHVENPDGTYLGFGKPLELLQGETLLPPKSPPLAAAVADLTKLMLQQNELILRVTGHNKTAEFQRWEAEVQHIADWVQAEETAQAEGGE